MWTEQVHAHRLQVGLENASAVNTLRLQGYDSSTSTIVFMGTNRFYWRFVLRLQCSHALNAGSTH